MPSSSSLRKVSALGLPPLARNKVYSSAGVDPKLMDVAQANER